MTSLRAVCLAMALIASAAGAQVPGAAPGEGGPPQQRVELERRFRQRMAEIVREQLNLNPEQMRRLRQVNVEHERRRNDLMRRERALHAGLRRELSMDDKASQEAVSALLDSTVRLHRERAELLAAEQRELAAFLTPVQRAKYFGLQTQLRRRLDQMRARNRPRAMPR